MLLAMSEWGFSDRVNVSVNSIPKICSSVTCKLSSQNHVCMRLQQVIEQIYKYTSTCISRYIYIYIYVQYIFNMINVSPIYWVDLLYIQYNQYILTSDHELLGLRYSPPGVTVQKQQPPKAFHFRIYPSLNSNFPLVWHDVSWFILIYIDFYWILLIFIVFHCFSHSLPAFSLIYVD